MAQCLFIRKGFDISPQRIAELKQGKDRTNEVDTELLQAAPVLYSCDPQELKACSLLIVAVPTPIDKHRSPDLCPVKSASKTVGQNLSKGSIVVYESTVYPGLTEEICVPLLEKHSGLVCGQEFFVGYSPERINPGDKAHTLQTIVKVVAGQTPVVTELLDKVYSKVVQAGTFRASSIKVAEAAKVIENTQRDLNIALMNELATIFDRMNIDTLEVLEAAGTKWNFLPFRPGLVGGHCIGVDPYYLTFKAESLGLHPQVILAGRETNDSMAQFVVQASIKQLIKQGKQVQGARIGLLGITFKENVPDLRNTRSVDLIAEFQEYGANVLVHDAQADPEEAMQEYNIELTSLENLRELDALVLAVPHEAYRKLKPEALKTWFNTQGSPLLIDIKGFFDTQEMKKQGFHYWRL